MNCPQVPRLPITDISEQRFLTDYVARNHPVIVTGALEPWNISSMWTPASLGERFGDRLVQVYNNYFDLQSLMPLQQYLSENFGKRSGEIEEKPPYVRWYTKLRDVDFCWADEAFTQLQRQWSCPSFVPSTDYVLPCTPTGCTSDPVTDHFPAKGLFISPRGARTSLHVDPWGSCAVLCQLYGTKRWYFYGPKQAEYLQNESGTVDVTRPDMHKFPAFSMARLSAICTLKPGEIIYVPHGWFHQVECDSDSVSLTWNFVHRTTVHSFIEWLSHGRLSAFDESVLRFFYRIAPGHLLNEELLARIQGASVT